MGSRFGMSKDDLLTGLREGRLTEKTAAAWLEANAHLVRAHSNAQVAPALHRAIDTALGTGNPDEYDALFPPSAPLGPAHEPPVYETGTRQPVTSWDGYVSGGTPPRRERPFAVVQTGPLTASAEVGDDEADSLFPPRTWAQVDARHQAREVAAGRRLDYSDEELHDALFGDTTGKEAGGQ